MQLINSAIDSFTLNKRKYLVKRDELLNNDFNGNKARKLAFYLENDFPQITQLISYGGTQSNMLIALSHLAKIKNWEFIYYCYPPSQQALLSQQSNFSIAAINKTQFVYVEENLDTFIQKQQFTRQQLLIHQGGRQIESMHGIAQLANEINEYATSQSIKQLAIFLPSGTGTTAFYLQNLLQQHQVITTNCVGDHSYLLSQWQNLINKEHQKLPTLLANNNFRFATPNLELWQTIQQVQHASQIEFDLVYDPVGWNILLKNLETIDLPILYLHCGGLTGNSSMINRYDYKFPDLFAKI